MMVGSIFADILFEGTIRYARLNLTNSISEYRVAFPLKPIMKGE